MIYNTVIDAVPNTSLSYTDVAWITTWGASPAPATSKSAGIWTFPFKSTVTPVPFTTDQVTALLANPTVFTLACNWRDNPALTEDSEGLTVISSTSGVSNVNTTAGLNGEVLNTFQVCNQKLCFKDSGL